MSFKLLPRVGNESFWRINQGKRFVGRVYRRDDGWFVGRIGEHEATGATERQAFDNVGAQALGFRSMADLREHNATVVAARSRRKQAAQTVVQGMLSEDRGVRRAAWEVFTDLLTGEKKL
jgi:hypothetical protein